MIKRIDDWMWEHAFGAHRHKDWVWLYLFLRYPRLRKLGRDEKRIRKS